MNERTNNELNYFFSFYKLASLLLLLPAPWFYLNNKYGEGGAEWKQQSNQMEHFKF